MDTDARVQRRLDRQAGALELLAAGYSEAQVCEEIGINSRTWQGYKTARPDYARHVADAQARAHQAGSAFAVPGFEEFRYLYLGRETYPWQRIAIEAMDDESLRFLFIGVAPEAGKSTLITCDWLLWRILQDRDLRTSIVCDTENAAKKFLFRLQHYLTNGALYGPEALVPTERSIVDDFGHPPLKPDGTARTLYPWDQSKFYIGGRRSGEKDPTCEAVGSGGHIYGARWDIAILDDVWTVINQRQVKTREYQRQWLEQEVETRLGRAGRMIIPHTRVHRYDNYAWYEKAWSKEKDVRFLKFPAIVNDSEGKERSYCPQHHTLEFLVDKRQKKRGSAAWDLVYMQRQPAGKQAIFDEETLDRAQDNAWMLGQYAAGEVLVLGVDPATSGPAAAVLQAVDPKTGMRRIIDLFFGDELGTDGIRERLFLDFIDRYSPRLRRIVVENMGFQKYVTQDPVLVDRCQAAGIRLEGHRTSGSTNVEYSTYSKVDPEYGVEMDAIDMRKGLLTIAGGDPPTRERMAPLIDQAGLYGEFEDSDDYPMDTVMAMWIGSLGVRRMPHRKKREPQQEPTGLPAYLTRWRERRAG